MYLNAAEARCVIELHIPEGINYECSGCGRCCGGWAVPMTEADYERAFRHDWGEIDPRFKGKQLARPMKDYESEGTPYSYVMIHDESGFCPFLVNNLCFIHGQFGAREKPSMCQLFPYCFNETPSGIYTMVSFYSNAVVYNTGKALKDQRDVMEQKWQEFQQLHPGHHPNWSAIKLVVGQPITWEEYIEMDEKLIEFLKDRSLPIEERMLKGSDYLVSRLARQPATPEAGRGLPLKKLDKHLLVALHKIYFPAKPLNRAEFYFNWFRFLYQVAFQGTKLAFPGRSFTIEELHKFPWPERDPEIEELLFRYFYSRVFSKFYFGAGLGQLSVIAGFHHLILVLALIKLHAKGTAILRQAPAVSFVDVAATVILLEKRLGEVKLGGNEAAIWELLMTSPARLRRVLDNA